MKKVILDVDPGHDDAIAIMLASLHPEIDLLGITVVAGNQILEKNVINTLNVCSHLNFKDKVYRGQAKPIVRQQIIAGDIHGESGLDGVEFEPHDLKVEDKKAVNFIIDTLMESDEKIYLVPTGPLTNIGLALALEPRIKEKIEKIVLMGGARDLGNVTPAAEFNIVADPEAARIVFESGCDIVMMGLDVTRKALCYEETLNKFRGINKTCDLYVGILEFFTKSQKEVFGWEGPPLHDPTTLAYLIDESLFEMKHINVTVDSNSDTPGYGRTYCDYFGITDKKPNALVAFDINREGYYDLILETLKGHI